MVMLMFDFLKSLFEKEEKMSETDCVPTPNPVKTRVSDVDFVKNYLICKSYGELAFVLDLTTASVQQRANKLRKAGVTVLQPYAKAKKSIDVEMLNSLSQLTQ
jgi:hypothetical protein